MDMASRQTKYCPRCHQTLPVTSFGTVRRRYDGLQSYCKGCCRERNAERYRDPIKRERHLAKMRRYYEINREHKNHQTIRYRGQLRLDVLRAYGGEQPRCACCGEPHVEFLELDHINNDGAAHRREVGNTEQVLRWLRQNDYPPGYQILCGNCNSAKYIYGECPHQQEQVANEAMRRRSEVVA